jgi:hypothetical protein
MVHRKCTRLSFATSFEPANHGFAFDENMAIYLLIAHLEQDKYRHALSPASLRRSLTVESRSLTLSLPSFLVLFSHLFQRLPLQ